MKFIVLCLSLLISYSAFAQSPVDEVVVKFKGTKNWELQPTHVEDFAQYMKARKDRLVAKVPELKYPESFVEWKKDFSMTLIAVSPEYQQREVSCQFFRKIAKDLNTADKEKLVAITQNYSLCIPRDVVPEMRTAWSNAVAQFIWNEPWIKYQGLHMSLANYLSNKTMSWLPFQTKLIVSEKLAFDGYAYGFSEQDLKFIAQSPDLTKIYSRVEEFHPDYPETVQFGPQVRELLKQAPYSAAGFFIREPTIIISNSWAPVDLPELLSHEYGHIYHGQHQLRFSAKEGLVSVHEDRAHDEGAAEAFAAQTMCHLYDSYPETEYLHLMKLHLMLHYRNNDPHYVGAAAYASKFHFQCKNDLTDLVSFVSAKELEAYNQAHPEVLPPVWKTKEEDMLVHFQLND